MKTFEDKLHESAQRIVSQDNRQMHVPQNPLMQKATYWGWVATPAAAVLGIVLGMSAHLAIDNKPNIKYVHKTDTIHVVRPVHDTLYLTQIVEKEKYIVKQAKVEENESVSMPEEAEVPACTSIQCDGINYSILALN